MIFQEQKAQKSFSSRHFQRAQTTWIILIISNKIMACFPPNKHKILKEIHYTHWILMGKRKTKKEVEDEWEN